RKISEIISVIDGIAFQTNILALNAAVEAARAGEQGRGFAVVASEVRTLAQRSAGAAKEIKQLIDDSVQKVADGSGLVRKAGTTMGEIVSSVQRVTDIMAEISAASQEQTAGIEQVSQTVVQMDETTQQNAALVEEASAAARAMEEQASQLVEAVAVFRLEAGAAQPTARTESRPGPPAGRGGGRSRPGSGGRAAAGGCRVAAGMAGRAGASQAAAGPAPAGWSCAPGAVGGGGRRGRLAGVLSRGRLIRCAEAVPPRLPPDAGPGGRRSLLHGGSQPTTMPAASSAARVGASPSAVTGRVRSHRKRTRKPAASASCAVHSSQ